MAGQEMAGRGLAFPLQLGVAGLAESTGIAKVEESIRVVLGTRPGERVMRPDFGSLLGTLAFAPNTPATADLARWFVTDSLGRWEPRIEVLGVEVANDLVGGRLVIELLYRLRATGAVATLVQPVLLEGT